MNLPPIDQLSINQLPTDQLMMVQLLSWPGLLTGALVALAGFASRRQTPRGER
jgi:hypothetical protein